MTRLSKEFYIRKDILQISKELLGKKLVTQFNGIQTSGIIVETEAYAGHDDKASHAYNNRRTKRTEIMYAEGGVAYVYLCYGIHSLFNVITNEKDVPHAVLVRAVEPLEGIELMLKRRKKVNPVPTLTNGPGSLSQALGIHYSHTGLNLSGNKIWIEDNNISYQKDEIIASPRVGIAYAEEHAGLPWRFRIKGNKWIGK